MATPPPPSGVRRHSAATGADVQQQFNWSENPFSTASPAASMSTPTSTAGMHECVGVGGGGGGTCSLGSVCSVGLEVSKLGVRPAKHEMSMTCCLLMCSPLLFSKIVHLQKQVRRTRTRAHVLALAINRWFKKRGLLQVANLDQNS